MFLLTNEDLLLLSMVYLIKLCIALRYPPHGRRAIEENILWNRLRAPPVDIPPHVLHVSECLADLKPGDHVEIQWRKSKEFSYGVFVNSYLLKNM